MDRELKTHGPTRKYFELLEQSAEAGDVESQTDFGMWLLEGRRDRRGIVLRQSRAAAIPMLQRAATARSSMAALTLGDCYADGIGVRKDLKKAEDFYRVAARAGEHFAASNLATLYRDRGEEKKERQWLKRAVVLGDETAHLTLAEIDLAKGRGAATLAARRLLLRQTRSRNDIVREEAQEILEHYERTGHRRWDPEMRRRRP